MTIECKCPNHPAWIVITPTGQRYATAEELSEELERRILARAECEAQIREVEGWITARHAARTWLRRLLDWLA